MQEAAVPNSQLPEIPGKRYFTIGEVSELCGVKTHVLRYWEQEFPSLKPMKRRGNRRYYQREDVLLIRHIRGLLYEQGYTISGARQKMLDDANGPCQAAPEAVLPPDLGGGEVDAALVAELEHILRILKP